MPFVLLFVFASAVAPWLLQRELPWQAQHVAADRLGSFYAVEQRNALVKLDSLGNELFRYQRNAASAPHAPDVTDPMKPMLFYPMTGTTVFLDNTLAVAGALELQPLGFFQNTVVARASDNRLWVYDGGTQRLQKIELNGAPFREPSDVRQQAGFAPNVVFMREHEQRLFMADTARGIIVTDAYGNYETLLPITGAAQFQFHNDRLAYFTSSHLVLFDTQTMRADSLRLEGVPPFQQAAFTHNRLLTLHQNGVRLYRRMSP